MTKNDMNINEKKVWDEDVKDMSYDDLMAAVRFLDQEREMLSKHIHIKAAEQNNKDKQRKEQTKAAWTKL